MRSAELAAPTLGKSRGGEAVRARGSGVQEVAAARSGRRGAESGEEASSVMVV